jgi:hypothetical protein
MSDTSHVTYQTKEYFKDCQFGGCSPAPVCHQDYRPIPYRTPSFDLIRHGLGSRFSKAVTDDYIIWRDALPFLRPIHGTCLEYNQSIFIPFPNKFSKILQRSTTSMPPLSSIVNVISDLSHKSPGGSSFIIPNAPSGLVTLHSGPSVASEQTDRWADALEQIEISIASVGTGFTIAPTQGGASGTVADRQEVVPKEDQELGVPLVEVEVNPEVLILITGNLKARGVQIRDSRPLEKRGNSATRPISIVVVILYLTTVAGYTWLLRSNSKEQLKNEVAWYKKLQRKHLQSGTLETDTQYAARVTVDIEKGLNDAQTELDKRNAPGPVAKIASASVEFVARGYRSVVQMAPTTRQHREWFRMDERPQP